MISLVLVLVLDSYVYNVQHGYFVIHDKCSMHVVMHAKYSNIVVEFVRTLENQSKIQAAMSGKGSAKRSQKFKED